jgi:hypothetical protein
LKQNTKRAIEAMILLIDSEKEYIRLEKYIYCQDLQTMFEEFCHIWKKYLEPFYTLQETADKDEYIQLHQIWTDMLIGVDELMEIRIAEEDEEERNTTVIHYVRF